MMEHFFAQSTAMLVAWTFALTLCASMLLKLWLSSRQIRHVARHRDAVPAAFAGRISLAAHHKAADYTIVQARAGIVHLAWSMAITLGWTLLGGLSQLNQALHSVMAPGLGQQLALLASFTVINTVLDLPFSLHHTFVIEQRFGFNRTTPRLWLQDALKSTLLAAAIGLPLAAIALWFMDSQHSTWWLWVWAVWVTFNLLALVIYPTWIAPWFNQFKPLDDPALSSRVQALMARCGFHAKGFFVMDGSKRSAHANAYFTGLGNSKRVVFYDTLLKQLHADEVDAVLAHELGHFKHRHIAKRIVLIFSLSLLCLAALGWLSQNIYFYMGLGVEPNLTSPNSALALILFMLVLPLISTFVSPVLAYLSRRHEFEADAFATAHTGHQALPSALLKLYEDNAATLTPDPVYVQFYYSHPPASERLARMQASAPGTSTPTA